MWYNGHFDWLPVIICYENIVNSDSVKYHVHNIIYEFVRWKIIWISVNILVNLQIQLKWQKGYSLENEYNTGFWSNDINKCIKCWFWKTWNIFNGFFWNLLTINISTSSEIIDLFCLCPTGTLLSYFS